MFLKRITVSGFKSFANKTVLDLEPGITAVVGPNGSGKSNLADAVRWALGEQSKGRLRLSDREEIVFAGTEKRARASFAEVTLLFDNEDGSFGVDLTEVEISRRLYRSGESDYRLGGRTVRLSDIQLLLAEAGFGTGSYAVIGQGVIDSFLTSSPSERKLLFDEAAGIRSAELKRESSVRKLNATATNLTRLRDIAAELEPRLEALRRTAAAAAERVEMETKLQAMRQRYVDGTAATLADSLVVATTRRDELAQSLERQAHEQRELERDQAARLKLAASAESGRATAISRLADLEVEREAASLRLVELRAQVTRHEQYAEQLAALDRRLETIDKERQTTTDHLHELEAELKDNQAAAAKAQTAIDRAAREVNTAQAALVAIRQQSNDGTQQQYVTAALEVVKSLARKVGDDADWPEVRRLVHKAGRLLSNATNTSEAELLVKLKAAQSLLETAMTRRETATEHQTNITITTRSLELDVAHQHETLKRLDSDETDLAARRAKLTVEAKDVAVSRTAEAAAEAKLAQLRAKVAAARETADARPEPLEVAQVAEEATRLERLKSHRELATQELATVKAKLAQLAVDEKTLADQCHAWELSPRPDETAKTSGLGEAMVRLEADISARLALEADHAAELAGVGERAGELAAQIADLEAAEIDLHHVLAELDDTIRRRFRENFAALGEHFNRNFVRLFGGGQAALNLRELEGGEYGIDIQASPKGKRLGNLAALSGGERALAGVALLAAILQVNPSPFVVLDEIDAALDEANSGRLASLLEELKDHSQLIVITHNRQTMRAARILFGVTMNEHHVSNLLSLRLEEATSLAAR